MRLLGRRDDVADLLAAADVVVSRAAGRASRSSSRRRCAPALRWWPPTSAASPTVVGRRGGAGALRRRPRRWRPRSPACSTTRSNATGWRATAPARAAELPDDADAVGAALAVYRPAVLIVSKPVDGLILQSHT